VESAYLRVTGRSRARLRRYLVRAEEAHEARLRLEDASPASSTDSVKIPKEGDLGGRIRPDGVRRPWVAYNLRSGVTMRELLLRSLVRGDGSPRSRGRSKGKPAEVDPQGAKEPRQEIQQEPMVHGT